MILNYRWIILFIMAGSQFVLSIAAFGWGPLAPFLKKIMSLSASQIGAIGSTFYFAAALSSFPAGIIVDRHGVKKGLLLWLGLTGLPLILLSLLQYNYAFFLILGTLSGLGYGMGNPVASNRVIERIPDRPSHRADQNAETPLPTGDTTPSPVTTTCLPIVAPYPLRPPLPCRIPSPRSHPTTDWVLLLCRPHQAGESMHSARTSAK